MEASPCVGRRYSPANNILEPLHAAGDAVQCSAIERHLPVVGALSSPARPIGAVKAGGGGERHPHQVSAGRERLHYELGAVVVVAVAPASDLYVELLVPAV